jgi:phage terminase large subunit-like protein
VSDARLIVPSLDEEPWPTLGPELCEWIEDLLVHGPGDLLGEPIEQLTEEFRLFIYRAYEVYPRGHELAGRRRFKREVFSRRKGVGKTELAAWIAIAEFDPTAPVRCDGWRREQGEWIPVGRPVYDPYIPMVAVTEGQAEDLAYGAVYEILAHADLGNDYEIGLERIQHKHAPGEIQALAAAPSAREGARTTFQHFDETHLYVSQRLKDAHGAMLRNVPKRKAADAHSLETTTMYAPGEGSVAEGSHRYAEEVARGAIKDPRLLYDHRQAPERIDISTDRGLRAAIKEASGDAWPFTDVESIVAQFRDPQAKEPELRRFWLNQRRKTARKWLSVDRWERLADPGRVVEPAAEVVLAFDGSYNRDSTALVGCTVEEVPHIFLVDAWEKPITAGAGWRTPRREVEDTLDEAMQMFQVVELAPDPPGWHREIEDWEEWYEDVVVRFETVQPRRFGPACDDFYQAVSDGELTHDGSEVIARHIGNAVAVKRRGHEVITKSEADSPDKIDAAVAAVVAYHRARWRLANEQSDKPLMVV